MFRDGNKNSYANALKPLKMFFRDFMKADNLVENHSGTTKRSWGSFFNQEAEAALKEYIATRKDDKPKLFSDHTFVKIWKKEYEKTGVKVTPQVLREWFCNEMGRLGMPDRYVDAYCGRVPKSVLARQYSDFSPEKLREIYEQANLRVLD